MNKRIVITGVGVAASNGVGKDEFWAALKAGRSGIREISLFDKGSMRTSFAGEVKDFDAARYLGPKGLRLFDRTTKLINVVSKLALDDAHFVITGENTDRFGLVVGTTTGSVWSISEFDKQALKEGLHSVNPALFPNTVMNAPASQVAIRLGIKGFNTTVATGFTAGLDGLKYACDFIRFGRADAVLVGGVEEMSLQVYLGFYKLDFLAGIKEGTVEVSCPFDRRRNGIIFGEGAAVVLIEELESAKKRGAKIYGEIKSQGYVFDPFRVNKYNKRGPGIRKAIRKALDGAELKESDIDYISANANSTKEADRIEVEAVKEVFGDYAYKIPISSIKSMIGDTFSVSGLMQLAASVGTLERQFIPPTINFLEPDEYCGLDIVPNHSREIKVSNILINCFSPSGVSNCVVLSKMV